ncbi:helix-turn-helix transcriptional regulator [Oribacterium sp. oral taxon 102]|uniref:helix-turn-helix domain-containing protein n=1 Tax=Oribacterium sp. oral taxon 102 TaxID=671214 RepID=UPI0015BD1DD3|nr:helix-turn-helix transcriptional regulator [Oribacterium sp. oral taxon 102]NWO22402.1 helix-turn-helix transcriptional regulator [Oribacterium sp. oral taxon 102]
MIVSYNGLWKLLIDKNMKKMDLVQKVGISTSTLAKMGKGEPVSLEVLGKICDKLGCDFGDIINFTRS